MTTQQRRQRRDLLFTVMSAQGPTLSARQINRTVLDRQLLLTRAGLDIPTTLRRVGGLQTQYAPSGYIGLWSRLSEFERASLTRALEDRSVIQATLMRCTIHMVAADDFWPMCAGIQRSRREWWLRIATSRKLPEISYDALAAVVCQAFTDGALTRNEIVAVVERAGYAPAFKEGLDLWLDMVRVPPWGTWERRRADRYGLAEQWIPRVEVDEAQGLRLLLTRYLQAFGPAALVDAATWAGVPRARLEPIASQMELVTYQDENGASLVDLAGLELADETIPAPVRFLPTWDATLLVHCRRSGIIPEELRQAIFHTKIPQSVGTVLVDGAVAATWAWRSDRVEVHELAKLTARQRRDVAAEAEQLTAFYHG
jgi:Winged helix DNA-binding domain